MDLSPFLTLNCACNEAMQRSSQSLMQIGMRVMQTFDLHAARHALEDCPCPHHGTSECDCQMIVLLIYGGAVEPVTLILHGNDGKTSLTMIDTPGQKIDPILQSAIKDALEEALPSQIQDRI